MIGLSEDIALVHLSKPASSESTVISLADLQDCSTTNQDSGAGESPAMRRSTTNGSMDSGQWSGFTAIALGVIALQIICT